MIQNTSAYKNIVISAVLQLAYKLLPPGYDRYRLKSQSVNLACLQVSQVRLSRKLSRVNAPRAARSISHFIGFPHRIPSPLGSLRSLERRT